MKSLAEILEGGFYKSTGAKQASKTILAEQEFLNDIITKCVDAVKNYHQLDRDTENELIDTLIIHIKHSFVIHGSEVDLIISPYDKSNSYFHRKWSWIYKNLAKEYNSHDVDSREIIERIFIFCRTYRGKVTFEFTESLI